MPQGWRSSRSRIGVPDSRTSRAIARSAQSPRRRTTQKISADRARPESRRDRPATEAQHKVPTTHMLCRARECRDAIWIPLFPPEVQCRFVPPVYLEASLSRVKMWKLVFVGTYPCIDATRVRDQCHVRLGQKQTCALHQPMSALPQKADICSALPDVR